MNKFMWVISDDSYSDFWEPLLHQVTEALSESVYYDFKWIIKMLRVVVNINKCPIIPFADFLCLSCSLFWCI